MWSHVCVPVKILANELKSIEHNVSVISRAGYENMDGGSSGDLTDGCESKAEMINVNIFLCFGPTTNICLISVLRKFHPAVTVRDQRFVRSSECHLRSDVLRFFTTV